MPLKIAINGRFISRDITGVERYATEISSRLISSRIIRPKNKIGQITGNLWEQIVLPNQLHKNEILWSPANAGPWFIRHQVITIHDASAFDHPEWFKPSFAAWTRLSWRILAQRVRAIITVSNFSRDRLLKHLRVPDEKIHVIHNGVGKPFEAQSQEAINAVKEKYMLNKPYFLFVGTSEPRKNLTALIQAWESLNSSTHTLFIAGGDGKVFVPTNLNKGTAYIPNKDLPALYAGAFAAIFPSFYEGFGLPILEAMACGAPVIASDIPVFRELFPNEVLFVNPFDPNEIKDAMHKIIEDQPLARALSTQGMAHASKFSWDEAAQRTQALLESVQ